jgi:hypothetical protein
MDDRRAVVYSPFSAPKMDPPLALDSHLVPYAQAAPAQLAQALVNAREALGPYYPALTWPQWHKALEYLQPLLLIDDGQVSISMEGLTKLAHHFEAEHPLPPIAVVSSPHLELVSGPLPPAPLPKVKKTYSMRLDVLESLDRVSFWRRKGKSALVNLAIRQLMASYPESQIPIPITEV